MLKIATLDVNQIITKKVVFWASQKHFLEPYHPKIKILKFCYFPDDRYFQYASNEI